MQLPFGHPFDPREEREVLPCRQRPDERVELRAVADQTTHLTAVTWPDSKASRCFT